LKKNIFVFYNDLFVKKIEEKKSSNAPPPKKIEFYNFATALNSPTFEGMEVTVKFKDDIKGELIETGFPLDVSAWYVDNLYQHIRTQYDNSPPIELKRVRLVPDREVTYKVDLGEVLKPKTKKQADDEIKKGVKKKKGSEGWDLKKTSVIDKEILLEKEKQKTIQEKVKAFERLKELGMSNEEIKKYLGI
jgi:hypothetical protein